MLEVLGNCVVFDHLNHSILTKATLMRRVRASGGMVVTHIQHFRCYLIKILRVISEDESVEID